MDISVGDIVCFKKIYTIGIDELIRAKNYSKYMIVVAIIDHVKEKPACKVMCANGEINWVSMSRLQKK